MAVLLRCSSFFAAPNSPRSSPPGHFSGKSTVSGKVDSLLYKVEKLAHCGQFNAHRSLLSRRVMCLADNDFRKLEGMCAINLMTSLHSKLADRFPVQRSGMTGSICSRFLAMALLVSNAFFLATPFGALAETCEATDSSFNMPVLLFVSLVGATVGGLLARQRKGELLRLNEQLRQINAALRRQAKIESYAPSLSYAPVGSRISEDEVIVDPKKHELITRLKAGKNFLRNQDLEKAYEEFKAALELAQSLKDSTKEKKAARGLGASLQRQGKYREAIKYHSMVLAISEREGEVSGNTEACGAIADCYTELGDLEQAGKFYDKYIAGLEAD